MKSSNDHMCNHHTQFRTLKFLYAFEFEQPKWGQPRLGLFSSAYVHVHMSTGTCINVLSRISSSAMHVSVPHREAVDVKGGCGGS